MAFNPLEHLTKLSGKDYLPVAWRIAWFREEHPNGNIQTELITFEPKVIFKATIWNNEGVQIASAYGSAPSLDKGINSWKGREIEKAETAAIGRALGTAGYGTQFTDDFDEGENLADSPLDSKPTAKANKQEPKAPEPSEGVTRVASIVTKLDKNKQPYIVAGGVTFKSGQLFRDIAIDTSEWKNAGEHLLPYAVMVKWQLESGYKKPVTVYADLTAE